MGLKQKEAEAALVKKHLEESALIEKQTDVALLGDWLLRDKSRKRDRRLIKRKIARLNKAAAEAAVTE